MSPSPSSLLTRYTTYQSTKSHVRSCELGLHRIRGWDVLGGHVEPGETPGFAALRELEEESGRVLKETDLTLLGYERLREANRETYFVYYIAQVSKAETVCNVRDDYNDWNGSNDYEAMTTTRFFKADDLTREKWFLERPGILGALTDLVYKLEANNT